MEIQTTRIRKTVCPYCGFRGDATTGTTEPKPDDLTICINCLSLAQLTEDFELKKLDEETFARIRNDVVMWGRIQAYRQVVREGKRKGKNP